MKLFIQIRDGKPFEHPILAENLAQAFPDIDTENLPNTFAKFLRVNAPVLGTYEVYESTTYEWQGDLVTDVHHIRAMTAEEIEFKQNDVKEHWKQTGFASWQFNESTCSWEPPVPYPTDNKMYVWNEETLEWKETE